MKIAIFILLSLLPIYSYSQGVIPFTPAVIFDGNFVKALRGQININDSAYILTGSDDPTVVSQNAPEGSLYLRTSTGQLYVKADNGNTTNWNATAAGGSVSSVGLTMPTDVFAVANSPITTSGTFVVTKNNQIANTFWAGPVSGPNAPPGFRQINTADLAVAGAVFNPFNNNVALQWKDSTSNPHNVLILDSGNSVRLTDQFSDQVVLGAGIFLKSDSTTLQGLTQAPNLVFHDKNTAHIFEIAAPDTLSASTAIKLPDGNGSAGQVLTTSGGSPATTSWTTVTAGIQSINADTTANQNILAGTGITMSNPAPNLVVTLQTPVTIAHGGTGQASANSAFNALAPSQTSNSGKFLTTDGTNTSWASATSSPASPANSVQFNNAGAFGGSSNFVWDNSNKRLTVVGTTNPAFELDQADNAVGFHMAAGGPNSGAEFQFDATTNSAGGHNFSMVSSGSSNGDFGGGAWFLFDHQGPGGTANYRMAIDSTGKVGFGTIPAGNLHVEKDYNGITTLFVVNSDAADASARSAFLMGQNTGSKAVSLQYLNDGWVTPGGLGMFSPDTALLLANTGVAGLTLDAGASAGYIRFATGGLDTANERMRIDSSGNVRLNSYAAGCLQTDASGNVAAVNGSCSSGASPGSTNGAVQFNNSGAFGGDAANFFWDNTNKRIGFGTNSPAVEVDVEHSQNGFTREFLINTGTGTSSRSGMLVGEDGSSKNLFFQYFNHSWNIGAGFELLPADGAAVTTNTGATGGLNFVTGTNAPIRFGIGGFAASKEVAHFNTDGSLEMLFGHAFKMDGSTSGVLTHTVPATVTSYTVVWPAAQGASNTFLKNDGSGNLSWATTGGSFATTSLNNIASTSLSADLNFAAAGNGSNNTIGTTENGAGSANLILRTGTTTSGDKPGDIQIITGDATTIAPAAGGNILISPGLSDTAAGGNVTIRAGGDTGSGGGTAPGNVILTAQTVGGNANIGKIKFQGASEGTVGNVWTESAADGTGHWAAASGGSSSLSGLTAATATNTIDNVNFAQEWDWNSLTTQTAMKIASTNTTTGTLLNITNTAAGSTGKDVDIEDSATSASTGLTVNMSGTTGAKTGVSITAASTNAGVVGESISMTGGSGAYTGLSVSTATGTSGSNVITATNTAGTLGNVINASLSSSGAIGKVVTLSHAGTAGPIINMSTSNVSYADNMIEMNTSSASGAFGVDLQMNGTSGAQRNLNLGNSSSSGIGLAMSMSSSSHTTDDIQVNDSGTSPGFGLDIKQQGPNGGVSSSIFVTNNSNSPSVGQGSSIIFGNTTFNGSTGSPNQKMAQISGIITTTTQSAYAGALVFSTITGGSTGSSPTEHLRLDSVGHLISKGTAPTLSGCGTGATIAGTDVNGRVTLGTTPGGTCTVTFANAYANAPTCSGGDENSTTAVNTTLTASTSTVAIKAVTTFSSGDTLVYNCLGY